MGAQGVRIILGLLGTIILARLLSPADYGLIAMVMVIINFAAMFKDAGLSLATIQKDKITKEQISNLFWFNILISSILCLCVLAMSPLVSWFYDKPELTSITAVLSLTFLLNGLTIQHQALLQRHMRFGILASIHIITQIITLGVTITLCLLGWRYWALVGGTLASALSSTILTVFFCPWIPDRPYCGTSVRDMLKFGGHVTGSNMVNYFSKNTDNILIGKYIGSDALGLYGKAYDLYMTPLSQVRGPLTQVAMPVLCSLNDQPERYIKYYHRLIDILASLTMPLAVYCAIEADFLIGMLLGPQWLGTVPVFRILAIVGIIYPIAGTWGLATISRGFSDRYFYWGIINFIVIVSAFLLGLPYGIVGVATAYTVANYIIFIPSMFYSFHNTPLKVTKFLKILILPFLASALAGFLVFFVKQCGMVDSISSHLFLFALFISIYISISYCRKSVRETVRIFIDGFPTFLNKNRIDKRG